MSGRQRQGSRSRATRHASGAFLCGCRGVPNPHVLYTCFMTRRQILPAGYARSMSLFGRTHAMPTAEQALPGRAEPLAVPETHAVNGHRIVPPFPDGLRTAIFALGCFWGEEKMFWQLDGVYSTAAGYTGGFTPNPTYEEVCTGRTGHAESVLVVFDPGKISYADLLTAFWENHDPTQGYRQGNDVGTQYRSAIFVADAEQRAAAEASKEAY